MAAQPPQATRFVSSDFFGGGVVPVVLFAEGDTPQDTAESIIQRYCASKYPQKPAESFMTGIEFTTWTTLLRAVIQPSRETKS